MSHTATRVCGICKNEYPLTPEHWHRKSPEGFQERCKPCACAYSREWYGQHPERVAINRENSLAKRSAIRAEKRRLKEAAYVAPTHRTCSVCQQEFPLTSEFWNKGKGGTLSTPCKSCAAKRAKDWYLANTERARIANRKMREERPDKVVARRIRYKTEQPEKIRATRANNYQRYREKRIAYTAQWRRDNPGKAAATRKRDYENNKDLILQRSKEWVQANPERVKIRTARRRAAQKNAPGKFTKADLLHQFEKQDGLCFYCRENLDGKGTIDHYIPLSKGGTNWPDNIVLACWPCNNAKRAKLPSEFKPTN